MFKLVLEMAEEPEIKLPTSSGSSKKQESPRKTSISALLTMPKPLTVWITIIVEYSERFENTKPPDLHTDFSRGRLGGLAFPSLSEFSTVYCNPVKSFGILNKAEIKETLLLF